MDDNNRNATLDCWGIVELFGHSKIAGRLSESQIAGGNFLRVDVPEMEGQAPFTRYYGAGAIYSITPTDEKIARAAAESMRPRPITVYGITLPERQLTDSNGPDWREFGERYELWNPPVDPPVQEEDDDVPF